MVRNNAYGIITEEYTFTDTIRTAGHYWYRVAGVEKNGEVVLFRSESVGINPSRKEPSETKPALNVTIPLQFKRGTRVHVQVANAITGHLLTNFESVVVQRNSLLEIDLMSFVETGAVTFRILCYDDAKRNSSEFFFRLNEEGIPEAY